MASAGVAPLAFLSLAIAAGAAYADEPAPHHSPTRRPEGLTAELGLFGGIFLPSSRHELYDARLMHRRLATVAPDIGLRAGFFPFSFLGAEVEGSLIPTSIRDGGDGTVYSFRGHLLLQYPARIAPFVVAGGGLLAIESSPQELGDDTDTAFYWGLGAKAYLTELFSIRLDGRHILSSSFQGTPISNDTDVASHFEVLLGVGFTFPRNGGPEAAESSEDDPPEELDRDDDGFPDSADACPDEAGIPPWGCPMTDGDSDGVADGEDRCPNARGSVEHAGCPDKDEDDIVDSTDICPDRPGVPPHGCPADDQDGDGTPVDADQCAEQPGLPPHGCPDSDGDGHHDGTDECPDRPETANGYKDDDGCPDKLPEALARVIGPLEGVGFSRTGSALTFASLPVLDAASKVLNNFPNIRIGIYGHTDNTGDREAKVLLSTARAETVKKYFINRGINALRLESAGFGPDQPIETNKTAAGRAQNTRIELKILGLLN